ncbi:MAG: hypothetical protein KY456_14135 [Chloroflexi bacterium]|nr:hypothetical protein [Chloroflexota bacterium]
MDPWLQRPRVSGPANLLERGRRLLKVRYPRSDISRSGQAIAVQFDHNHIDVVPAFTSGIGYIIPNTSGNHWLQSNPKQHVAEVSKTNARSEAGGRLVPVAKIIKHWNYAYDYGMRGCFLEMWARDIFYAARPDYAHGRYSFFNSAINWLDKGLTVPDPSPGTDLMQVFLKTNSQRTTARSRFVLGLNLAVQAIDANDAGDNAPVIANWKRLFAGDKPEVPAHESGGVRRSGAALMSLVSCPTPKNWCGWRGCGLPRNTGSSRLASSTSARRHRHHWL